MANGGKRANAGRKPGSQSKKTLEQKAVSDAFNQRVMRITDRLFNAQSTLALGSMKVFRIDEIEIDGKTKRSHVHVTDTKEIIALLDKHEGNAGEVENVYYYFSDVLPDNKALDSMLNRALGKPKDELGISGSLKIEIEYVNDWRG